MESILVIKNLIIVINIMSNGIEINVGTGASCIYPLLASKKNKWQMTATDIDLGSINVAQENINRNNLQHLIQVKQTTSSTLLKDLIDLETTYDFCMCNPPFFSSTNELDPRNQSRSENRRLPRNALTGKANEVVALGGEVEFISKLIKESVDLKLQVKIFTTMVGKKSSTIPLKFLLRTVEVVSFKQTEFHQGHTTRWALAWTFQNIDLRKVPQHTWAAAKKKPKPPLKFILPNCDETTTLDLIVTKVRSMLQTLQMEYDELKSNKFMYALQATAKENTWSHQRRKRREQLRKENECNAESGSPSNNEMLQTSSNSANGASSSTLNSSEEQMDVDLNSSTESTGHKRSRDDNSDDEEYFNLKKMKNDDPKSAFLKINLFVRKLEDEFHLEMIWVEGTAGPDSVYQVMQYFKNKYV